MSRVTDRFSRALKALDTLLVRTTAVLLAMLFMAQAMLLSPVIRRAVNTVEKLEGESLEVARRVSPEPKPAEPRVRGSLTVTCKNGRYASAVLLVNGQEVADFSEGSVTVEVLAGDLVEIDGGTRQRNLTFVVSEVSSGMVNPVAGCTIETKGTIEIIARVRMQ